MIVVSQTEYVPEPYQQMLLFWAATAIALFINILASTVLPKIEGFVLLLYIAGFFAVLLPLVILGEHQDPHQVFGQWMNQGEYPTQGLSSMVGLVGAYLIMTGADGAIHVSILRFENLRSILTHSCADVRGDPGCSDCCPLVNTHQHHLEWCFGFCDDDGNTLRGREFGLRFDVESRIRLHRNFH